MPVRTKLIVDGFVRRAIETRLQILYGETEILLNDLQVVLHRIDTMRDQAELNDIRIGRWLRVRDELCALRSFAQLCSSPSVNTERELFRYVNQSLSARLMDMHEQSRQVHEELSQAVANTTVGNWGTIRTAGWFKASTEGRVFRWLATSLEAIKCGGAVRDFDEFDGTEKEDAHQS